MSLFQVISNLFDSIFRRSSPEVQKKQLLKKIESVIKEYNPAICRNGMLLPNFGEAIFALYKNTRPLDNLFSVTLSASDIPRQHRFEAQLIMTGYPQESQEVIESLSFENRKADIEAEPQHQDRVFIRQRKAMEKVLKELNSEDFRKMDSDIINLRQLVEFCHYNFVPFMQLFDTSFIPSDFSYRPNYMEVPITKTTNLLEDLCYQMGAFHIDSAVASAVLAVARLRKGSELTDIEREGYLGNLKKINFVLSHVLTTERIKMLLKFCHEDVNYEPQIAKPSGAPRQEFANMLQSRYEADEQRIKTEIQNETISEELSALFPNIPMQDVGAYNQNFNTTLQKETSLAFKWILPLQVLKTFLTVYVTEGVKNLLNDISIEGFFNNPEYKSRFSSMIYSVSIASDEVQKFEDSFTNGQKNSISVLQGYIADSKRDKDFYNRLEKSVAHINDEAHALLQTQVTVLHNLSRELAELLEDSKKPSCELISNLKVLMMSSRNRDQTNILEAQYQNWNIFFEIMKNYVIINTGNGEMNHE
jgi:hypothetical protein